MLLFCNNCITVISKFIQKKEDIVMKRRKKNPVSVTTQVRLLPKTKPLLLTISLLVSNRIDTIRKCMDSIKPILDSIPSELIVVDTGSTDGSIDIVREYTDNIVSFDWCDDFAAARNAGLEHAKGEWFLYLDDDEWFEDVTTIIDFFQSEDWRKYASAGYRVRNYHNKTSGSYQDAFVMRMSYISKDLKFVGEVHEVLMPLYSPTKEFDCYVHHYGYAYETHEQFYSHFERNMKLLKKQFQKHPQDVRCYLQMIQEYRSIEEYGLAKKFCYDAIALEQKEQPGYINWVYVELIKLCLLSGEPNKAITEGERLLEEYPMTQLARMGILCAMFDGLKLQQTDEAAQKILKNAIELLKLTEFFQKNPNELISQQILSMREVLEESTTTNVCILGIQAAIQLKKFDQFCQILRIYLLGESPISAAKIQLIETAKKAMPQKQETLIQFLAKLELEDPYIYLQRLLVAQMAGNQEKMQAILKEYLQKGWNCLTPYEQVWVIAVRNRLPAVEELLGQLDEDNWRNILQQLVQNGTDQQRQELFSLAEEKLRPIDPVHTDYLNGLLYEAIIFQLDQQTSYSNEQVIGFFEQYSKYIIAYYRALYQERLFQEENTLYLPKPCRFSLQIQKAFKIYHEQKYNLYLQELKTAIEISPGMAQPIKVLIYLLEKELPEEQTQAPNADEIDVEASAEFIKLAIQVKQEIKRLIAQGNDTEAACVLQQLKLLVPSDPEIELLEEMIKNSTTKNSTLKN